MRAAQRKAFAEELRSARVPRRVALSFRRFLRKRDGPADEWVHSAE